MGRRLVSSVSRGGSYLHRANNIGGSIGSTNCAPVVTARHLSSHGQEAAGRLKDALEQYRAKNYAMETPSRFRKEIAFACADSAAAARIASTPPASTAAAAAAAATASSLSTTTDSDRLVAVEGIEGMLR